MICHKKDFRYIEQLKDGSWIVRYAVLDYGKDGNGNELVSFASSVYPDKPSMDQIRRSIHRYAMANLDNEEVLESLVNTDISNYTTY